MSLNAGRIMDAIEVQSISHFLQTLDELLQKCNLNNEQVKFFFRGETREHEDIRPTLYNGNGALVEREHLLFKDCVRMRPYEFADERTTFEKLAKMQHFSLPTRLLDISSNPLVALYFATRYKESQENKDGRVIVLRVPSQRIKFYDSDTVSVVANICKRTYDFITDRDLGYLLHDIREEKSYFQDCIDPEHLEKVWCVKPLMKNPRMIQQDGLFLLFGIEQSKRNFAKIRTWNFNDDEEDITQSKEFIIPAAAKETIRKNLAYLGFSKDKLFPDLQNTAEYLNEHYKLN